MCLLSHTSQLFSKISCISDTPVPCLRAVRVSRRQYHLRVCLFTFPPSSLLFRIEYLSLTVSDSRINKTRARPRQRRAPADHFLPLLLFLCAFAIDRPSDDEPSLVFLGLPSFMIFSPFVLLSRPPLRLAAASRPLATAARTTLPYAVLSHAFSLSRERGLSSSRTTFELTARSFRPSSLQKSSPFHATIDHLISYKYPVQLDHTPTCDASGFTDAEKRELITPIYQAVPCQSIPCISLNVIGN